MSTQITAAERVAKLVARARKAQLEFEAKPMTQDELFAVAQGIAWAGVKYAEPIAKRAAEESRMGNYESKLAKMNSKMRGGIRDLMGVKTNGVVEEFPELGITHYLKPVGVIGGIVPCTNPEATPFLKAMSAIITKNAIIFSPHPRTAGTQTFCTEKMQAVLKHFGLPTDLILSIDNPTMEDSAELMKQCDLILATGGSGLVTAAYSSGTPALGVGAGNAIIVVDETADLDDASTKIVASKTFDYATSCSADNSLVVQEGIYDDLLKKLQEKGGHLCTPEQQEALRQFMFLPTGHYNGKAGFAGVSPEKLAEMAGLKGIPAGTKFYIVQENPKCPCEIGNFEYPFGGEKLCVVLNIFKYKNFDEAIAIVNACHEFSGKGHSCGIHTKKDERARELAAKTYVSRVMVNQPTSLSNSGSFTNGMPFTLSLGCATWGGNSVSENINWKHLVNNTWLSRPIPENKPSDDVLFGSAMKLEF